MAFQLNLGAIGVDMVLDRSGWKKGIADAQKDVTGMGGKLSGAMKGAGIAAGAALAAGVVVGVGALAAGLISATKSAAEFERSIARAGAKAGATKDEMRGLGDVAKKVGLETAFSAQEAAAGLDFLAMAGLNASEQMKALPGIAQLASAGNLELAAAADIATNIMSGMGLAVDDLARVNDVLAKAATSSNTSVEELGQGMSFAAPIAAGLGITMEETAALIGKMSDAGIKSGRAGRGLNAILKKTGDVAEALGVSFKNADFETKGFAQVLGELEAAGLTSANAMDLFGGIAGPGITALLNQGIGSIEDLTVSLDGAAGAAQELVDKELDTLDGQLTILKGTIETVSIAIGQQLTPLFKPLIKQMVSSATAIGDNADALETFRVGAASATRTMGDFIIGVSGLVEVSTMVLSALQLVSKPFRFLFIDLPLNGIKVIGAFVSAIATGLLGALTIAAAAIEGVAGAFDKDLAASIRKGTDALEGLTNEAANLTVELAESATFGFVADNIDDVSESWQGLTEANKGAAAEVRKYGEALHDGAAASDAKAAADREAAHNAKVWQGATLDMIDTLEDEEKAVKAVTGAVEDQIDVIAASAAAQAAANEKIQDARDDDADAVAKHYQRALDAIKKLNADKLAEEKKLQEERRKLLLENNPTSSLAASQAGAAIGSAGGGAAGELASQATNAALGLSSVASITTGLVGVFTDMWTSTKGFKEAMALVNDLINDIFAPIMEGVMKDVLKILKPIVKVLRSLMPVIRAVLFVMNPWILGLKAIGALFTAITKPFKAAIEWLKKFGAALGGAIKKMTQNFGDKIKGMFGETFDREPPIIITITDEDRELTGVFVDHINKGRVLTGVYVDHAKAVRAADAAAKTAKTATRAEALNRSRTLHTITILTENEARRQAIKTLEEWGEQGKAMLGIHDSLIDKLTRETDSINQGFTPGFELDENGIPRRKETTSAADLLGFNGTAGDGIGRFRERLGWASDALEDFADSVLNAPEVFDAQLARFQARGAGGAMNLTATGDVQQGAGNTYNIGQLVVQANDPDELQRRLEESAVRRFGTSGGVGGVSLSIGSVGRSL